MGNITNRIPNDIKDRIESLVQDGLIPRFRRMYQTDCRYVQLPVLAEGGLHWDFESVDTLQYAFDGFCCGVNEPTGLLFVRLIEQFPLNNGKELDSLPNSIQCSSCKSHLSTLGLIGLDMTCDYCGRLNTIEL